MLVQDKLILAHCYKQKELLKQLVLEYSSRFLKSWFKNAELEAVRVAEIEVAEECSVKLSNCQPNIKMRSGPIIYEIHELGSWILIF